jgi:hypothetical protein
MCKRISSPCLTTRQSSYNDPFINLLFNPSIDHHDKALNIAQCWLDYI